MNVCKRGTNPEMELEKYYSRAAGEFLPRILMSKGCEQFFILHQKKLAAWSPENFLTAIPCFFDSEILSAAHISVFLGAPERR